MKPIPAHVPLRVLRVQRGLTSPALARLLADNYGVKVDPDHILAVELGRNTAGPALRNAWAEELGIKPGDIHMAKDLRAMIADADADVQDDAGENGAGENGAAA